LEYDQLIGFFENGKYIVAEESGNLGVVDRSNNEILSFAYGQIYYEGNGRFLVYKDNACSVVGAGDQILAGPLSGCIMQPRNASYPINSYDFSEANLFWVTKDNTYWGLVDRNLQFVIPVTNNYSIINSGNTDGVYITCHDWKFGLIDQNGRELLPMMYTYITDIGNGFFIGSAFSDTYQTDVSYVFDKTGKVVFSMAGAEFEPCYFVDDFPAAVRAKYQYESYNGMVSYRQFGAVDGEGHQNDSRSPFYNEKDSGMDPVLQVRDNSGKVGLYKPTGEVILPIQYDDLHLYDLSWFALNPNAIIATKDGLVGMINSAGDTIVPFEYNGLETDYLAPNNYNKLDYIETLKINDGEYTIGAINGRNERVADDFTIPASGNTDRTNISGPQISLVLMGAMGYGWLNAYSTFSPINGLFNGHSSSSLKSRPESPVLAFPAGANGYPQPIIDEANNRLMYIVNYKDKGNVIVFDGFSQATAPVLGGWPRDIQLTIGDPYWTFNGARLENDVAPFISQDDRTLVPVRVIAESAGASVEWNDDVKTEYITKGGVTLSLTVDKQLPDNMGAAVLVNDRLFVPVRYIAENLNGTVTWDADTKTVGISFK